MATRKLGGFALPFFFVKTLSLGKQLPSTLTYKREGARRETRERPEEKA